MEYRVETKSFAELYDEAYFRSRGMRTLLTNPYDRKHFDQFLDKLRKVTPLTRETRVLDLACGLAQRAYYLADQVKQVTAVDIAPFAIQFAQKNYRHERLRLLQGDVLHLPDRGQYDLVLLVSIYEHLDREQQNRLLELVKPRLAPGGRVIVHVAIAESFLGRRKNTKNETGTIDFTGDHTHVCKFSVADVEEHFRERGFRLSAEYRRMGSYGLSGRKLENLFTACGAARSTINEFVVEWLPAFEWQRG